MQPHSGRRGGEHNKHYIITHFNKAVRQWKQLISLSSGKGMGVGSGRGLHKETALEAGGPGRFPPITGQLEGQPKQRGSGRKEGLASTTRVGAWLSARPRKGWAWHGGKGQRALGTCHGGLKALWDSWPMGQTKSATAALVSRNPKIHKRFRSKASPPSATQLTAVLTQRGVGLDPTTFSVRQPLTPLPSQRRCDRVLGPVSVIQHPGPPRTPTPSKQTWPRGKQR